MTGTLDTRVCDTRTLTYLCEVAEAYGFNRRLRAGLGIDPDGTHLLALRLFDHQRRTPELSVAQRAEVRRLTGHPYRGDPVHNRVQVLIKVRGSMTPQNGILDIPAAIWNQLPLVDDVLKAQ